MRTCVVYLLLGFFGLKSVGVLRGTELAVPGGYPSIQAAVNVARANDVIRIAPGVYAEQVSIVSNKLTLIGQPGTILRATTNLKSFEGSVNRAVLEIRNSEVTVRGLTFEGERLAERFVGAGDLLGIFLRSSSGNVEDCAFYGFRESAPGSEGARAILIAAIHAGEVDARVTGCTFADIYGAVFCWGLADRKYINVTIEDNVAIGLGPIAGANSYAAIQIGEGVGGRIAGNTISGFSYVGTAAAFPISFGILVGDSETFSTVLPINIEGNSLENNQMHIALTKAGGSVIRNNRLQGTAAGILPIGMAVSGTNVTIASNQFENMPEGIRLLGNDPLAPALPGLGNLLGYAVGAQVTSNRFRSVTTSVNRQTPATATEQGTVQYPFPAPVLNISPAVVLSWPELDDDYFVEFAPAADGPWGRSDGKVSTENGRQATTILMDGENRFFRLQKQ